MFARAYYPAGIHLITLANAATTYGIPYSGAPIDMVDDHFYWDVPDGKYVLAVQIDGGNPFAMTLMINGDIFAV